MTYGMSLRPRGMSPMETKRMRAILAACALSVSLAPPIFAQTPSTAATIVAADEAGSASAAAAPAAPAPQAQTPPPVTTAGNTPPADSISLANGRLRIGATVYGD